MDGEGNHLCDCGEAGDRPVVGRVLFVTALEDQHGSSFKEPAVLFIPCIDDFPFDQTLHQLKDGFPDCWAFFDGEGVDRVDSACFPGRCASEDLIKFRFCKLAPSASSVKLLSLFMEDFLYGLVISPSMVDNLVVDTSAKCLGLLGIWSVLFASSILCGEAFVPSPEDVESSVLPLFLLRISPHLFPYLKLLFPF